MRKLTLGGFAIVIATLCSTVASAATTDFSNGPEGWTGNGIVSDSVGTPAGDNFTASLGAAVPEPATWGLMILGFGAIGGAMRVQRRKVVFA